MGLLWLPGKGTKAQQLLAMHMITCQSLYIIFAATAPHTGQDWAAHHFLLFLYPMPDDLKINFSFSYCSDYEKVLELDVDNFEAKSELRKIEQVNKIN